MTEQAPTFGRMRAEVRMVLRGATRTHRFLRARLTFLIASTLLIDAVATVLMYWFEAGNKSSGFDDLGGAFFWVSAQLTTVSSQMPNPVSTPGACSTCSSRCGRSPWWRPPPRRSPRSSTRVTSRTTTRSAAEAELAQRDGGSPGRASRGSAGGSPRPARRWARR